MYNSLDVPHYAGLAQTSGWSTIWSARPEVQGGEDLTGARHPSGQQLEVPKQFVNADGGGSDPARETTWIIPIWWWWTCVLDNHIQVYPVYPIILLSFAHSYTRRQLSLMSVREGFQKKQTTNLGFWLNLRWVGVRRGSWCPTPLNRFSFIALNWSK